MKYDLNITSSDKDILAIDYNAIISDPQQIQDVDDLETLSNLDLHHVPLEKLKVFLVDVGKIEKRVKVIDKTYIDPLKKTINKVKSIPLNYQKATVTLAKTLKKELQEEIALRETPVTIIENPDIPDIEIPHTHICKICGKT